MAALGTFPSSIPPFVKTAVRHCLVLWIILTQSPDTEHHPRQNVRQRSQRSILEAKLELPKIKILPSPMAILRVQRILFENVRLWGYCHPICNSHLSASLKLLRLSGLRNGAIHDTSILVHRRASIWISQNPTRLVAWLTPTGLQTTSDFYLIPPALGRDHGRATFIALIYDIPSLTDVSSGSNRMSTLYSPSDDRWSMTMEREGCEAHNVQ